MAAGQGSGHGFGDDPDPLQGEAKAATTTKGPSAWVLKGRGTVLTMEPGHPRAEAVRLQWQWRRVIAASCP